MECLVTKLKATVDDPTLEILGEFSFSKKDVENPTVDTAYTSITTTSACTIKLIGDTGCFYENATVTPVTEREKELLIGENNIWIAPNSIVSVRPKYGISDFVLPYSNVDITSFRNISGLKRIILSTTSNKTGDISALKGTKLSFLDFGESPDVTGNLDELDLSELTVFTLTKNKKITGNIATCFGKATGLNTINIAEDTGISGSINDLVSARRRAGQTTGSINFPYAKTISAITFNGTSLSMFITGYNPIDRFTWDASGNITYSNS